MRLKRALQAPLGYLVAAAVFTWPLVLHPTRVLASVQGPGDSYLNLWILGWDLRTLSSHPGALVTGQIFNANIFHPAAGALAYSDHFLLQSIALLPVYLTTHSVVLCYNLLFFTSLVAAAWAMHTAVRAIVGSDIGAWTAGLAWGFAPYHFGHFIHIQLQAVYFLPLAFLFLHRTVTTGRTRDACLLGVTAAASAIGSVYYGVIGSVSLGIAAIVMLSMPNASRPPRLKIIARLALAAVIGTLLVAPIAWQYLRVQHNEGFGRSLGEARQGSASLRAYVTPSPDNLLYGRSGALPPPGDDDQDHKASEQMLFPGFALMALAAFGLWRTRRDATLRPVALALLLIAIAGVIFSLGPDGVRPLYAFAHRVVFGFQAIRAPARFAVLVLFGLAGLAAIGTRAIAQRRPRLALVLLALVSIEYLNAPLPYVTAPQLDTRVGAWLRDAPEPGAVMYQPLTIEAATTTPFMVESLQHGRPIVNGYSGLRPAFYDGLAQTMTQFPSLETIKALDDLGVRFVVAPAPLTTASLPLIERARFDDGIIYQVQWTEGASAALAAERSRAQPLPPLGPLPFRVGETAVYSIVWATGPLSIPAGRATFRVEPGKNGAHLLLSLEATTASWVSRFFEANDRFESSVDETLRPIVFDQRLREGSRNVDRRVSFDRTSEVVRLKQGDAAEISVPATPDSLDPLSTIYYLRAVTFPAGGEAIRLPVNDWGRDVAVSVSPGRTESVAVGNSRVDAVRLEPRVLKRDSQPAGYRLTLWLSQDSRRVPLVMTIDGLAGVGSVRLELLSFTATGS